MPAPEKQILLSVAVITRNRPEILDRCLGSLRAQSVQPMEIIVSDDSDPALAPDTRAITDRWEARYLKGPGRGLYANRNHSLRATRGTNARTVDDDHTFPPRHFERCLAAVESDPAVLWTTGEISFIGGQLHATAETANQLHPSGVGGPVRDLDRNWAVADGSTIYPKAAFQVGWEMIEMFSYGSSYLEFGAFLHHRGIPSRCLRETPVEHHATMETLGRGRDPAVIASHLFASVCFNFFFQPNRVRGWRYILRHWARTGFGISFAGAIPGLLRQATLRWETTVVPVSEKQGGGTGPKFPAQLGRDA